MYTTWSSSVSYKIFYLLILCIKKKKTIYGKWDNFDQFHMNVNCISQTCIKSSPLGQRKNRLIRQVTSWKRLNSYELFYDRTRKWWPFINTGDCMGRFNCNVYIEEEQTIVSNRIRMKANLDKRIFFLWKHKNK